MYTSQEILIRLLAVGETHKSTQIMHCTLSHVYVFTMPWTCFTESHGIIPVLICPYKILSEADPGGVRGVQTNPPPLA